MKAQCLPLLPVFFETGVSMLLVETTIRLLFGILLDIQKRRKSNLLVMVSFIFIF